MQFSIYINQPCAAAWGLNLPQSLLFGFLYNVPSWAEPLTVSGETYYRLAKNKILTELPLLTDKPDTAYRLLKELRDKGLIVVRRFDSEQYIALTEKTKLWNGHDASVIESDKNPNLGNISEPRKKIRENSEKNPNNLGNISDISYNQDHITNIKKNISASDSECGSQSDSPRREYLTKKNKRLTGKLLALFEQFWEAFDFKNGKRAAADAWLNIRWSQSAEENRTLFEQIVSAAKIESANRKAIRARDPTHKPKWAEGWLSASRWEDEIYSAEVISHEPDANHSNGCYQPRQSTVDRNNAAAERKLREIDAELAELEASEVGGECGYTVVDSNGGVLRRGVG